MEYKITRYEEKSDALFICISSLNNPVYLEHFFTPEERLDNTSRKETIERLVAELELRDEAYVEPEKFVSKVEEAEALEISPVDIATKKAAIILEKEEKEAKIAEEVAIAAQIQAGIPVDIKP